MIAASAKRNKLEPEVLASLLHAETKFDFFMENETAKKGCDGKADSEKCSKYGWEKGIGQIGKDLSKKYGLDWNTAVDRPAKCTEAPWNDACISALEEKCSKVKRGPHPKVKQRLHPYNCPREAIEAAARRLARGVSEKVQIQAEGKHGKRTVDVTKELASLRGTPEHSRYLVSAYNRGPRIANAFAEHLRQEGAFPKSYGAAWATPRDPIGTPSKGSGFQILQGEYINRCYVYSIVGICDGYPKDSLVSQYRSKFRNKGKDARQEELILADNPSPRAKRKGDTAQ